MNAFLELIIAICLTGAVCLAGEPRFNCSGGKVKLSEEIEVLFEASSPLQELMLQGPIHALQDTLGARVKVARLSSGRTRGEWQEGEVQRGRDNFSKYGANHPKPKPKPKPTSNPPNTETTKGPHQTTPKPPPNPNTATSPTQNPPNPATTGTTNPPNPPNPVTTATPNPPNPPNPATSSNQDRTTPRPVPGPSTTQRVSTTPEGRRTTGTTTPEQRRTTATTTPERRRTTPPPAVVDLEVDVRTGLQLFVRVRRGGEGTMGRDGFHLSIGRSEIDLTADSVAGALRGLQALVSLREDHFLSECEVY